MEMENIWYKRLDSKFEQHMWTGKNDRLIAINPHYPSIRHALIQGQLIAINPHYPSIRHALIKACKSLKTNVDWKNDRLIAINPY